MYTQDCGSFILRLENIIKHQNRVRLSFGIQNDNISDISTHNNEECSCAQKMFKSVTS